MVVDLSIFSGIFMFQTIFAFHSLLAGGKLRLYLPNIGLLIVMPVFFWLSLPDLTYDAGANILQQHYQLSSSLKSETIAERTIQGEWVGLAQNNVYIYEDSSEGLYYIVDPNGEDMIRITEKPNTR